MSNGISIGGDMHGDVVQGNQHKGDIVHGNKDASQGAVDVAGDLHGGVQQAFSQMDDDMALMTLAQVSQSMADVLMVQSSKDMAAYTKLVDEWRAELAASKQTKPAAEPAPVPAPDAETKEPTWVVNTREFFVKLSPTIAKAALAGGLAALGAMPAVRPFLAGLKAVLSSLYESVDKPDPT